MLEIYGHKGFMEMKPFEKIRWIVTVTVVVMKFTH